MKTFDRLQRLIVNCLMVDTSEITKHTYLSDLGVDDLGITNYIKNKTR